MNFAAPGGNLHASRQRRLAWAMAAGTLQVTGKRSNYPRGAGTFVSVVLGQCAPGHELQHVPECRVEHFAFRDGGLRRHISQVERQNTSKLFASTTVEHYWNYVQLRRKARALSGEKRAAPASLRSALLLVVILIVSADR